MLTTTMPCSTYVPHKRKHICAELSDKQDSAMDSSGAGVDIANFATRDKLPVNVNLVNFDQGPRGHCNKRDGAVLGRHPGCTIPASFMAAESVLATFFLHHDIGPDAMKTFLGKDALGRNKFTPPVFVDKMNHQFDDRARVQFPIKSNEQWIGPNQSKVHWKKKQWQLSRNMKNVAGVKFPQFVVVLTPRENGILNYSKSVRSSEFEVRSKDQPRQSAFAAGRTVAKRRTPETFRAQQALKAVQADILKLTDGIRANKAQHEECKTRLDFALAIAQSDPRCAHFKDAILKYMRFHKM